VRYASRKAYTRNFITARHNRNKRYILQDPVEHYIFELVNYATTNFHVM